MLRIRFASMMLAICGGTSAAQSPTLPARTLDVGAIVRLSTDSGHIVGQLATPLNTGRATLVNLFPCSRCAIAQYPISDVRTLDLREGSSRGTHVGLGFLVGAGIGGAVGALAGSNTGIVPDAKRGSAAGPDAVLLGAAGAIIGIVGGALLPVRYHWLRVLPARQP